jgi:hypothetical protein
MRTLATLEVKRERFNLDDDGHTLLADASDLALGLPFEWPDAIAVMYGANTGSIFTRVRFDRTGDEIQSARYSNLIGQALVIFND